MAPRDIWDLLQPNWADRMGATAWDPPNLPLFEGAPWPTPTDAVSAGGPGQAAPLYPVLGYSQPLPLVGANSLAGTAASSDQGGLIEHLMRPITQNPPAQGTSTAAKSNSDAATAKALLSFNDRWPGPRDFSAPAVPLPRPRPLQSPEMQQPPFTRLIPVNPLPSQAPLPNQQFYPGARGYPLAVPSDDKPDAFEDRWWDGKPVWLRNMSANMSAPRSETHFTSPPDIDFLKEKLREQGVDASDFLDRIIYVESQGNTYEKTGPKGPLGAGQMGRETWRDELVRRRRDLLDEDPWLDPAKKQDPRKLTLRDADEAGVSSMRGDYALSRQRSAEYADQLARQLVANNFEATPGNVYLMYLLGPNAGMRAMRAIKNDPNTPARSVVAAALDANPGLDNPNQTISQLQTELARRIMSARPDLLPFRRTTR
jgi:hypothetical protein